MSQLRARGSNLINKKATASDNKGMRGNEPKQSTMTTFVSMEQMVEHTLAKDQPLRVVKAFADAVLKEMDRDMDAMYAPTGRPSIAPELLLRALLWQALFSVRSETQLMEQIQFNTLARWFVGLPQDIAAWDHSTISANRKNLGLELLAEQFFLKQLEFLDAKGLLSTEHLSVDGTLLKAWASQKSVVPKSSLDDDGNPPPPPPGGRNDWVDFKG